MVLKISSIMSKKVVSCSPSMSVLGAVKLLKKHKVSTVVVVNSSREVLGIFTERDLVDKVASKQIDMKSIKVKDVMTAPVVCATKNQTDVEVIHLMITQKVSKIPILSKTRVVGLVSEVDILRSLGESVFQND